MQPQKRKKQAFLNIKSGEMDETRFYKKILFRNLNSFLILTDYSNKAQVDNYAWGSNHCAVKAVEYAAVARQYTA